MARKPNIRWRESDLTELRKSVDRFNKKIDYWSKKGHPALPDKIKLSDLKGPTGIKTRADYNREMNRMARFSRRGAEEVIITKQGVPITKYEKREYSMALRERNRKAKLEKERQQSMPVTYEGQPGPLTRSEMGRNADKLTDPMKSRLDKAISRDELKRHIDSALKQSRDSYLDYKNQVLKANYFKAMREQLNHGDYMRIRKAVDKLTPQQLADVIMSTPDSEIPFIYSPTEYDIKVAQLENVFRVPARR